MDRLTRVVFAPAAGVKDLDEWFGRLDAAVSLRTDARWHAEALTLSADLPEDEAQFVVERAREALGDAIEIRKGEQGSTVIVTDVATGHTMDEG